MNDTIIKGTAANNQIRFFCAYTRELVETSRTIHNTSPVATAALGRLLTAGAIMGSMGKNTSDRLTLQIQCSGPIGGLTVTANAQAQVKGFVNQPSVMLPPSSKGKLDVGKALGSGILSVIRDIGLKEPYIGQSNLVSGEIAEDLTYYFATSEQIPTSVALGVLMEKNNTVKHAGGFILQLMPFAEESLISDLETRLTAFSSVTALLDQGLTPRDMMNKLFEGYDVTFNNEIAPCYRCDCSKERIYNAVMSIGRRDIEEMIADNKPIEVNCHFCNQHYLFGVDDLKKMLQDK
ncbi:MAG: Hsp33 family molecular chaperone HslO [Bacteroidales bacterium]|nr:Hsp33 family molecular chaperone HslO [Clostridium sp.]MCM1204424.1 Hsp33 family molecular chaperone HslO [Bacteroidales bacterium]